VMTGGAESYFSAFAIFLQASTTLVGLLASLPPLLASFMQVLSAWLGRRTGRRKLIIVSGALFQAVCLLPLAFLPWLFPEYAAALLIPIVFLYLCGPNLGAPQWNSLIGDLLPVSRRGRYFAWRARLATVASVSALAVAGLILDGFDRAGGTYWGFLTIFLCAAVARCASAYHLNAMHEPSTKTAVLAIPDDLTIWRKVRQSHLPRFSLFYACMQFAVAISGPYFTLYMLRDLQFSYLQFMIITVASVLVQFLTLNRWGRLSDLFGNRLILITTGSIIMFIPSLWLFSTNFFWILCVQALSGLGWAGFTLSATAFVFDLTPARWRRRPGRPSAVHRGEVLRANRSGPRIVALLHPAGQRLRRRDDPVPPRDRRWNRPRQGPDRAHQRRPRGGVRLPRGARGPGTPCRCTRRG